MKTFFGFDFDGTLTPIVSHPEKVKVSVPTIRLIKKLNKEYEGAVLILSGRPLNYLKKKFSGCGFYLAGNHGFECAGPKVKFVHPKAKTQAKKLQKIKKWTQPFLRDFNGPWLEDKKYTFSIHYRSLPKNKHPHFLRKLKQHLKAYPGGLGEMKLRPGKCVLEIRPKIDWDKGKMYEWLFKKLKFKPKKDFFFYAGDDVTDEDVFKKIKKYNSLSIYVGTNPGNTKAEYFVRTEKDLQKALKMLFL